MLNDLYVAFSRFRLNGVTRAGVNSCVLFASFKTDDHYGPSVDLSKSNRKRTKQIATFRLRIFPDSILCSLRKL